MTNYQLLFWRILLGLFVIHAMAMVVWFLTDRLPYVRCLMAAVSTFALIIALYGAFKYGLL